MNWLEILDAAWHSLVRLLPPGVPTVLSLIALYLTLKDGRPKLLLRPRKSAAYNTYRLQRTLEGQTAFVGGVEVYNLSGRPNAVRDYAFWRKDKDGVWRSMESQNYKERPGEDGIFTNRNQTPVTLAPYSGAEIRVMAFAEISRDVQMDVRIEIEDLFGNRYRLEVNASA